MDTHTHTHTFADRSNSKKPGAHRPVAGARLVYITIIEVWDRNTHAHTHTQTHTRTHIQTHAHMHTNFPDKGNVKKNQVCTGQVNLI